MMLPSRLTLRPESAAEVANSPSTMTETKIAPTTTPGRLSGRMIGAEDAPEAGAEIARRLDHARVDARQHEGDRADHEDDVDLRHADDHRELGEQQLPRSASR